MQHGTQERLDQLLASYGADRRRWPASERGARMGTPSAENDAHEIDGLLGLASNPVLPENATARLMARIPDEAPAAEVILFRPRPVRSFFRYAAAVPLAASLALGVYLGAQGSLDFMLPTSLTGDLAQIDDNPDELGGVGDVEAYAQESFS